MAASRDDVAASSTKSKGTDAPSALENICAELVAGDNIERLVDFAKDRIEAVAKDFKVYDKPDGTWVLRLDFENNKLRQQFINNFATHTKLNYQKYDWRDKDEREQPNENILLLSSLEIWNFIKFPSSQLYRDKFNQVMIALRDTGDL